MANNTVDELRKEYLTKYNNIITSKVDDINKSADKVVVGLLPPTTAEMNIVSKKFWWTDYLQKISVGVGGALVVIQLLDQLKIPSIQPYVEVAKQLANAYGALTATAAVGGVGAYSAMMKSYMKTDVVEGRSIPSGETPSSTTPSPT